MKTCSSCGGSLADNASFCNVCGMPVENQSEVNAFEKTSIPGEGTIVLGENDTVVSAKRTVGDANLNGINQQRETNQFGTNQQFGGAGQYENTSQTNTPPIQFAQQQYQQPYGQSPDMSVQANPAPSFIDCIKIYFMNYVNFSGRSRRAEYWYIILFQMAVVAVLGTISGILSIATDGNPVIMTITSALLSLWNLACIIPSLALIVRRLHDLGKSGIYILMALIPFAGAIIMIVYMATDSNPNPNEYGYSPKYTPGVYI